MKCSTETSSHCRREFVIFPTFQDFVTNKHEKDSRELSKVGIFKSSDKKKRFQPAIPIAMPSKTEWKHRAKMSNTASPTVVVDVERMIAFASGTAAAAVINGFNHINKHHHPMLQHLRIYDQCIAESQNL
jgi:hypothetical protein